MEEEEEGGRERERARKAEPAHWRVADDLMRSTTCTLDKWEREFLASIRAKESLSKPQRDSLEAIKTKAAAVNTQAAETSAAPRPSVWIWKDTPQWEAWSKDRPRPWPTSEARHPSGGKRPGWYFPSEWPPSAEEGRTDLSSDAA